jgi:hypothetical protein
MLGAMAGPHGKALDHQKTRRYASGLYGVPTPRAAIRQADPARRPLVVAGRQPRGNGQDDEHRSGRH